MAGVQNYQTVTHCPLQIEERRGWKQDSTHLANKLPNPVMTFFFFLNNSLLKYVGVPKMFLVMMIFIIDVLPYWKVDCMHDLEDNILVTAGW